MSKEILWTNRSIMYTQEELDEIVAVAKGAIPLTQGDYLELFENKFKNYLGVKHAYAVNTGSNALDLSAMLLELGEGDEVIIPAHTWCATAISFAREGASIKWADIDEKTLVMSLDTIKKVVTPKTRAIVIVHLYGLMVPMEEIMEFAKANSIIVIEDCAQSLGAKIGDRKSGTFGDISIYSFHSNKGVTTLGEGGMITFQSDEYAETTKLLRHVGAGDFPEEQKEYWKPAMSNIVSTKKGVWPYNFSIGEVQCAIGAKLVDRIDELTELRNQRAEKFKAALADFQELEFQHIPDNYTHSFHCFVARYNGTETGVHRDKFIDMIWNKFGVKVIVQNCPLYRYPLFIENDLGVADCPNSDSFFDNMVSFPFEIWMSEDNFNYMINSAVETCKIIRNN
jgi:perosamine synthetase